MRGRYFLEKIMAEKQAASGGITCPFTATIKRLLPKCLHTCHNTRALNYTLNYNVKAFLHG